MLTLKWDKIVLTCILNKFPDLFKVDHTLRNTGMMAGDSLAGPSPLTPSTSIYYTCSVTSSELIAVVNIQ